MTFNCTRYITKLIDFIYYVILKIRNVLSQIVHIILLSVKFFFKKSNFMVYLIHFQIQVQSGLEERGMGTRESLMEMKGTGK